MVLGVAVSAIFGAGSLNDLSTNVWMNVIFFVLFVIFAISFFGAFEITLPNSWINKADKQADRGGLIGIFFMAFTLALVSFSCTGPIVGSVLVKSAEGGFTGPIVAMVGFSTALALPFGLFAAFPGWLNSLPQSGGWLNTVKVTLGFLELAFALKFLSNADLVVQGHYLERELFLAIWIGIFLALALYLFGVFKFPHDSDLPHLSVGRGMTATIVLAFVMYMIPGLWGAPLKLLSGFPPGISYSESPYGIHGHAPEKDDDLPETAHYHGHGIWQIRDYKDGLEYAKKVGKPVFLDFTGFACVNCRKMEENTWPEPGVLELLKDEFVVVSLFVDDRTDLSAEQKEAYKSWMDASITNRGSLWKKMEQKNYEEVTQPMYVILDHNERSLNGKANYDTHSDPELFSKWLNEGLKKFELIKEAKVVRPSLRVVGSSSGDQTSASADPSFFSNVGPLSTLKQFTDLDHALAYAKVNEKPVMVYFTGYACVNARKMEEGVFAHPEVLDLLKDEVVLASLHVDDRMKLDEPMTSPYSGKECITVGDRWADLESEVFGHLSQPLFVMVDGDMNKLSDVDANYSTHKDPIEFADWLRSGIKAFKS